VTVDFLIGCREHVNALRRARDRAAAIELMLENPQKLMYGDWLTDPATHLAGGSQWGTKIDSDDDDDLDGLFDDIVLTLDADNADDNDEGIQYL
jgi:hypothetical protein